MLCATISSFTPLSFPPPRYYQKALVDGALKEPESALIHRYGAEMGRSPEEVDAVLHDVATIMLSNFAGVTIFRDQAVQIGRSLGLDDDAISAVLDADAS